MLMRKIECVCICASVNVFLSLIHGRFERTGPAGLVMPE